MDLGEAERLERHHEFTELADIGEGLRMPRPYQGLTALGLEKINLPRVDGNAAPILLVQQDAVFEKIMKPVYGFRSFQRSSGGIGRLSGRFGG